MPRYCLFGDTINTTSRMQSSGEGRYSIKIPIRFHMYLHIFDKVHSKTFTLNIFTIGNKIQISKTTWLMLSMKGGYLLEERGFIQIKVKCIRFWFLWDYKTIDYFLISLPVRSLTGTTKSNNKFYFILHPGKRRNANILVVGFRTKI